MVCKKMEGWQDIIDSIGWKIHNNLKRLNTYKIFFDRDFLDLLKKIYEYKENLSYFWRIKKDGSRNLDDFLIEFNRYLHHFLMSLESLRQETMGLRKHLNKEFGLSISEEKHQKKLEDFNVDEFYELLKNLRHEFAHRREIGGPEQVSCRFYIKNHKGEIYIGSENNNLLDIVKKYKKSIDNYYSWFFSKIESRFSEEIEETKILLQKFNLKFSFPTKIVLNVPKEFVCYKCKTKFISNEKTKGVQNKDGKVIGYLCDKCHYSSLDKIYEKMYCKKCKISLKDVSVDGYPTKIGDNVILDLFYQCPNCGYDNHLNLKLASKGIINI